MQKNVVNYMERLVYQQFKEWKNSPSRKPLVLNGARQVGKTWLLQTFAKQEYAKSAYFMCRKNAFLRQIFAQDIDVDRILRALRALSGVDITPDDTLIILDEVQDIPEALEALKAFREQAPQYHIAVAGSLLGLALHADFSYPVGQVDTIEIYPMSFEEFLLAKGEQPLVSLLRNGDYETLAPLHEHCIELLRQYFFVGGMPEVVNAYVQTDSLQDVRALQTEILRGYDKDFSKHAPIDMVARIRMVWQSIPSQLFKENKKFIYGTLRKGARAKDFELAIQWLCDAGLAYRVCRVSKLSMPIRAYEEPSNFKLYLSDIGLLGAMMDVDPKQILLDDSGFVEYKGGMTEQYVLQQMKAAGFTYVGYHSADTSRLEIDFLIQKEGKLVPIEVKAARNVRSNSLTTLLQSRSDLHAIRYSLRPYIQQEQMTNIPLYDCP